MFSQQTSLHDDSTFASWAAVRMMLSACFWICSLSGVAPFPCSLARTTATSSDLPTAASHRGLSTTNGMRRKTKGGKTI
ncbi:hypothetical protein IMZ48_04825 [Candidatus Bathyarchaeota archaeon]|nr:hypothetical protein [Candidatus Bathyarchaeota archaeon]